MKTDRLIAIVMLLLQRKIIPASELSKIFEVTTRTIYRDIETLNMAGIPVVAYTGVKGGISILESFKIEKGLFTINDITAILSGVNTLHTIFSDSELSNTISKLNSMIPSEEVSIAKRKSDQIFIDLSPWSGGIFVNNYVELIKSAMEDSLCINIVYNDKNSNKMQREIEPYRLVFKDSNWYLQGFCLLRSDIRLFKLSRISSLSVTKNKYKIRKINLNIINHTSWSEKDVFNVKLIIDKTIVDPLADIYGQDAITLSPDGKYIAEIPFSNNENCYRILLGFSHKCECVEPIEVKNELIKRIEKMSKIYGL